jgi:hypothetical protein
MTLFCPLWMPLFYIFWLTIRPENSGSGAFFALFTGAVSATVRFFVPNFIEPGGFGISRYISAFVDYTSVPVLFPLAVALLISRLCRGAGITDFTGFTLLAAIPSGFVCSIPGSAARDMLRMALTPLMWTAIAVAFYPLSRLLVRGTGNGGGVFQRAGLSLKVIAVFGFLAYSLLPPLVWWSFFSHHEVYGALLLIPALAPMLAISIYLFGKKQPRGGEKFLEPVSSAANRPAAFPRGAALKVGWIVKWKRLAALTCIVLLLTAALIDYFTAGFARYTFVFHSSDTGREFVEERMLARAKLYETNVNRYVKEALLGPLSLEAEPLFSRGARLETFLLRDGVVFLGVSEEAAVPQEASLLDTFRQLAGGIRRNFRLVKEVRFFIEGNEVIFN